VIDDEYTTDSRLAGAWLPSTQMVDWDVAQQALRNHQPVLLLWSSPRFACSCGEKVREFIWHIVDIIRESGGAA
jgi:hypothetical protein